MNLTSAQACPNGQRPEPESVQPGHAGDKLAYCGLVRQTECLLTAHVEATDTGNLESIVDDSGRLALSL